MKLNPHMITALYLRQHPNDIMVHDDGKEVWYCPNADKYLWRNTNAKKRQGIYEAKGLMSWWKMYLRECENWEYPEEEDLPY